jgi:tRNA(His) guanylyltransferase
MEFFMSDRIGSETFDALGDRLKGLEMAEAGRAAMPGLPIIARLDGRAFHTFTRGLNRPFDVRMGLAMQETAKALVEEFHADVGYTQSDEITLAWKTPTLFSGRYQKLTSVLAGYASVVFARYIQRLFEYPEGARQLNSTPVFDCRVFQVPDLDTVIDVLAWREYDAVKNSVSMAAQSVYSHSQLHKKGRAVKMDMLHAKGINWNDYPVHFKRGIYFTRNTVYKYLSEAELAEIPEKHRPTGPVLRSEVQPVELLLNEPIRRVGTVRAISRLFPVEEPTNV